MAETFGPNVVRPLYHAKVKQSSVRTKTNPRRAQTKGKRSEQTKTTTMLFRGGGGGGGGAAAAAAMNFVRHFSQKRAPDIKRISPKVPKEEAKAISQSLYQIIKDHGPLSVANTWNHAKVPINIIPLALIHNIVHQLFDEMPHRVISLFSVWKADLHAAR